MKKSEQSTTRALPVRLVAATGLGPATEAGELSAARRESDDWHRLELLTFATANNAWTKPALPSSYSSVFSSLSW